MITLRGGLLSIEEVRLVVSGPNVFEGSLRRRKVPLSLPRKRGRYFPDAAP